MPPRTKKLIGFAVFLPALGGYVIAAATLGERVPAHWLLKTGYFLVAGVAWALPAKFLISWMVREPTGRQKRQQ